MQYVVGIIIDVLILLVLFLCYKKGAKDGFAKTLVSLLGFVIAAVLASMLCAPISEAVYDKTMSKPINDAVSSALIGDEETSFVGLDKNTISTAVEEGINSLPSFIRDITGLESKKEEIVANVNESTNATVSKICDTVCESYIRPVVIKILSAIVFLLLFVAVWLICKIVAKMLKIINKLPLLGGLNKLLGGIIGLVRGVIFALVICFCIVVFTADGASIFGVITAQTVQSSLVLKTVATYNPLNLIITALIA